VSTLGDGVRRTIKEKERRRQERKERAEREIEEAKRLAESAGDEDGSNGTNEGGGSGISMKGSGRIPKPRNPIADFEISVDLRKPPPVTRDMRILEKWKMSLDFFVSGHMFKHLRKAKGETGKEEESPKISIIISETLPKHLEISFEISSRDIQIPALTLKSHDRFFYFSPELCTEGESEEESYEDLEGDHEGDHEGDPRDHEVRKEEGGEKEKEKDIIPGLQHDHATRIWTVVEMMKKNYLKPGVIVLANRDAQRRPNQRRSSERSSGRSSVGEAQGGVGAGGVGGAGGEGESAGSWGSTGASPLLERPAISTAPSDSEIKKNSCETVLTAFMKQNFGENLHVTKISAKTDDDKESIFGNPSSPIMGGLLGFIDQITSDVYKREKEFVLVLVDANELGQFMLREMLEGGNSETHRVRVKKERVLFLVNVEGQVSPQMESRAHHTLLF
jgi:hypothetical protein